MSAARREKKATRHVALAMFLGLVFGFAILAAATLIGLLRTGGVASATAVPESRRGFSSDDMPLL